jgi:DNA repair photolyase
MVSLTITTEDDKIAKLIEPNAPSSTERLKAAKILIDNDIPTSVRMDPIIPTINDNPENLIKTLASISVKHITASTYKVKLDNWQRFSNALPRTAEKLKPLYFEKGEKIGRYIYLPEDLRLKLMENTAILAKSYHVKFGTCRENLSQLNTATCDGSWLLSAST